MYIFDQLFFTISISNANVTFVPWIWVMDRKEFFYGGGERSLHIMIINLNLEDAFLAMQL